jgi:hypothetical protein
MALVSVTTNLNPGLAGYGRATLAMETQATEISRQLDTLTGQLRNLGELPEISADERVEGPVPVRPPEHLTSREYFKTYVPQPRDFVTFEIATVIAGFLITLPAELRPRRWLKIGVSMVLVGLDLLFLQVQVGVTLDQRHLSLSAYLGYLLPAILLAAIWTHDLCSIAANLVMHLIDSPGAGGTPVSHHGPVRLTARQGDFADALRLAQARLAGDDRRHYETFVLKAKLHQQMNHKWRAKWALNRALRDPHLTKAQRQYINLLLALLDDRTHACWKL